MSSKDIFEASFLLWSHYPKRVSKEIVNTSNWKTTNYPWWKQLLNPLSSPFHSYGSNFLPPQLTAIALFQHINPCNFSRSLVISLKFSVNITDPPRSWIMCKIYSNRTSRQRFRRLRYPKPYMDFVAFTIYLVISIHLELNLSIVTSMVPFVCFLKW